MAPAAYYLPPRLAGLDVASDGVHFRRGLCLRRRPHWADSIWWGRVLLCFT
jgi:hypothetical protein